MARIAAAAVALSVALSAFGAAGSAVAGTQTFGASDARRCMNAAFAGSTATTALEWCNMALAEGLLTPANRVGTLVNRGVLLMNRRDYASALADFEAALAMSPASGEALFNRGSVRIAQGRFSEGMADIDRSLALGLRQPEKAFYNRAIAREELSDAAGAYRDYLEAARLKPDWGLPRQELARFTVQRR
ncbi:MAG: tetratricopeptide repeat protein [Proteobacteria bacterium]|nr:tetratricopeptide repeat protein [Pseudomonadota bacterium]